MQDWKLPSQLVSTDRQKDEDLNTFLYRHEQMKRLTAESDLIKCLDFIDSLRDGKNEISPQHFTVRFLDKTINN